MIRTPLALASLALACALTSAVLAQDIGGYDLERQEYFTQCTTNGPAPDTARRHYIAAYIYDGYPGGAAQGALTWNGGNEVMSRGDGLLTMRRQIGAAAPGGSYTFNLVTATEGSKVVKMTLPPPKKIQPPRIRNFEAAQAVDPDQDFVIGWEPIKGAGKFDKVKFMIVGANETVLFTSEPDLKATTLTIPAGTLPSNSTNQAYLFYFHVLSLKVGRPYFVTIESRNTRFAIKTINPAGMIHFASNQASIIETNATIELAVERDRAAGTVTVDYEVEPITAMPDVNYSPTSGTLTFGDGVTSQTISVPVLDDGVPSVPRTARVRLSNVTGGATLAHHPWVDWTILDGEAAAGPNVNAAVFAKVSLYGQKDGATPDQSDLCGTSRFFASLHPTFPGAINNTRLGLRNHTSIAMSEPVRSFLEYNVDFASKAALDKMFRPGPYSMATDTLTEGQRTFSAKIGREPAFPTPHVLNWLNAQSIDSAAAFTLMWGAFTNATADDAVVMSLTDANGNVVMETPDVFEPGALAGSTASFELEPNALQPGAKYHVALAFAKPAGIQVDATSGTKTAVVFYHTTRFTIETAGAPGIAAAKAPEASGCCGGYGDREEPFPSGFTE